MFFVNRLPSFFQLLPVAIICAFVTTYFLFVCNLKHSCNYDSSTLCQILIAAMVTLLGVAVTGHIFLNTELQRRKIDNPYTREVINNLLEKNIQELLLNCQVGLIALMVLIITQHINYFNPVWFMVIMSISYVSSGLFISFILSIIDHKKTLFNEAQNALKKLKDNRTESHIHRSIRFTSVRENPHEYDRFLKNVSDIQMIVEKIIMNHSKQVIGMPESIQLSAILMLRTADWIAEDFSKNYKWLRDYRDLLLVASEMSDNREKTEFEIPVDFAKYIEKDLVQTFLHDEMLTEIRLSSTTAPTI